MAALSTKLSTAALDKNPQSKERGITLDLGFSSFSVRILLRYTLFIASVITLLVGVDGQKLAILTRLIHTFQGAYPITNLAGWFHTSMIILKAASAMHTIESLFTALTYGSIIPSRQEHIRTDQPDSASEPSIQESTSE